MLRRKDRLVGKKKKKLWKSIGVDTTKTIGQLSKHNSLNCGCKNCRMNTYNRRVETKQNRLKLKNDLNKFYVTEE